MECRKRAGFAAGQVLGAVRGLCLLAGPGPVRVQNLLRIEDTFFQRTESCLPHQRINTQAVTISRAVTSFTSSLSHSHHWHLFLHRSCSHMPDCVAAMSSPFQVLSRDERSVTLARPGLHSTTVGTCVDTDLLPSCFPSLKIKRSHSLCFTFLYASRSGSQF